MPGFSLLLLFFSALLFAGTDVIASQDNNILRQSKNNNLFVALTPERYRKTTDVVQSDREPSLVVQEAGAEGTRFNRLPWMKKVLRPPARDARGKRNKKGSSNPKTNNVAPPPPPHSAIAGSRNIRNQPRYDVPQIECPPSDDGLERFACPTADKQGRYRCIDDHMLCDGFTDCVNEEDEDRMSCMFYKTTKAHLDVLADALLRWARGRY